jgi:hypothetical protein
MKYFLALQSEFVFSAREPPLGQGLFIQEVPSSHTKTNDSR